MLMTINFTPDRRINRQFVIDEFSSSVKAIIYQDNPRSFNHEQVIKILIELAKNTYDHSNGIGILTIQLPKLSELLCISYQDTGGEFDVKSSSKFGVSKKIGNGVNYGMGLPLIVVGATGAGLHLSIQRTNNYTEFKFEKYINTPKSD